MISMRMPYSASHQNDRAKFIHVHFMSTNYSGEYRCERLVPPDSRKFQCFGRFASYSAHHFHLPTHVKSSYRLIQRSSWVLLLVLCFAFLGCTSKIPNKVTAEEMDLYREWLKSHFASKAPEHLYIYNHTFAYDPIYGHVCDDLRKSQGVSFSLCKQLHELGDAEYRFEFPSGRFNLPWPYEVADPRRIPIGTPTTLHIIGFSRIAFAHSHTEALFAISDSCGGECGAGGSVYARKEAGIWNFTYITGWIY